MAATPGIPGNLVEICRAGYLDTLYSFGLYRFDYFRSDQSQIWPDLGTQIRPEPEPDLGELVFGSQNNMKNRPLAHFPTGNSLLKLRL